MFQNRTLYHLSHIDLDGYSCQLLSSYIFSNRYYYNSNYGAEILVRLKSIFQSIDNSLNKDKIFILITDLNLSINEAKFLEREIENRPHLDIKIQLLDHHITGQKIAQEFQWYYLNSEKSATQITFEFIKKNFSFNNNELEQSLISFVDSVNSVDIWLQNKNSFEYGKVMMRLISSAREVNRFLFSDYDHQYKLFLLEKAKNLLTISQENQHIILDDNIHFYKKDFFRENRENNTLDTLLTEKIVELLSQKKEHFTIYYKGYRGILTYSLGNTSIIGNGFLNKNLDFDFLLDVSGKGFLSIRANGQIDVSLMAKEIGDGGGHKNASGGKIKGFKEQFIYENVKTFIQDYLDNKASVKRELPSKIV
jgi:oligoribonuclease NrnB/cAMP/cGMP phosphodiesterase (DHH superfamily)